LAKKTVVFVNLLTAFETRHNQWVLFYWASTTH